MRDGQIKGDRTRAERPLKPLHHFRRGGRTRAGVFGQELMYQRDYGRVNVRPEPVNPHGLLQQVPAQLLFVRTAAEGRPPRQQKVKNRAEAVKVRAVVNGARVVRLFGRGVIGISQRPSCFGGLSLGEVREPEIGDLDEAPRVRL